MHYNPNITSKYKYVCADIRAMHALAWARVALPHGLEYHVASTWVPRENKPPFSSFFNCFNHITIENKFKKILKNP